MENMTDMSTEAMWKAKHDKLKSKVLSIADELDVKKHNDIPDECISVSNTFYVSNHMEVVDNLEYAENNWGPGKYITVSRVTKKVIDWDIFWQHFCDLENEFRKELETRFEKMLLLAMGDDE